MKRNRYYLIFITLTLISCFSKHEQNKIAAIKSKILSDNTLIQLSRLIKDADTIGLEKLLTNNKDVIVEFPVLIAITLSDLSIEIKIKLFHLAIKAARELNLLKELLNKKAYVKDAQILESLEDENEISATLEFLAAEEPILAEKFLDLFLIEGEIEINTKYFKGNTLLHECRTVSLMNKLIKRGANVNAQNDDGLTVLHKINDTENACKLIDTLLANGADINLVDFVGDNPLTYYLEFKSLKVALHLLKLFPKLASSTYKYQGRSLLEYFLFIEEDFNKEFNIPFFELLIKNSEVKLKYSDGRTAMHLIARTKKTEMAKLILEHGADINAINDNGYTPLCNAVLYDNLEMVEFLLQSGADPKVRKIFTAFDFALGINQKPFCDFYSRDWSINWKIVLSLYKYEDMNEYSYDEICNLYRSAMFAQTTKYAEERLEILKSILKHWNLGIDSIFFIDSEKFFSFVGSLVIAILENSSRGLNCDDLLSILFEIVKEEIIKDIVTKSIISMKDASTPLYLLSKQVSLYETLFVDNLKKELELDLPTFIRKSDIYFFKTPDDYLATITSKELVSKLYPKNKIN